eukprot:scaffold66129_cov35-Tisochrysis_lutea.AAC.2
MHTLGNGVISGPRNRSYATSTFHGCPFFVFPAVSLTHLCAKRRDGDARRPCRSDAGALIVWLNQVRSNLQKRAVRLCEPARVFVVLLEFLGHVGADVAILLLDTARHFHGLVRRHPRLALAHERLDEVCDVSSGHGNVLDAGADDVAVRNGDHMRHTVAGVNHSAVGSRMGRSSRMACRRPAAVRGEGSSAVHTHVQEAASASTA